MVLQTEYPERGGVCQSPDTPVSDRAHENNVGSDGMDFSLLQGRRN
jgi:hypothetical protein